MTISISKEDHDRAVLSIQRYFAENMDNKIGNIAAEGLFSYFLEELAPVVYNKAVLDVQERLMERVSEVDGEIYENEFQFWKKSKNAN